MPLCASVYMCHVVTCWESADLLALVGGVYYEFVTFPLVSWFRCGTWLYRFLIFAPLLTFYIRRTQEMEPKRVFQSFAYYIITWLVITREKRSFEWWNRPLFWLMFLYSFVKNNLLFRIMDPLKRNSPILTVGNLCHVLLLRLDYACHHFARFAI